MKTFQNTILTCTVVDLSIMMDKSNVLLYVSIPEQDEAENRNVDEL
jgi:hypothetical protein